MGNYDDIINMPHHRSNFHKPMPMSARAAQFAPFAALNGHDDAITEAVRVTENFKELTEEEKNLISRKLIYAIENQSFVEVTFFIPDKLKNGGAYGKITGNIIKKEELDNVILLSDGSIIQVELISAIEIKDNL